MWHEGRCVITREDNCHAVSMCLLCVIGNISTLCSFINRHSSYESKVIHVYFKCKMIGIVEIWTEHVQMWTCQRSEKLPTGIQSLH